MSHYPPYERKSIFVVAPLALTPPVPLAQNPWPPPKRLPVPVMCPPPLPSPWSFVSCPVAPFSPRHFAVISGPWEPRNGCGPRYQVTELANHGTVTKLPASILYWFACLYLRAIWYRTDTSPSYLFFFLLGGDFLRAAHFAQIPCWGGRIYSTRHKENDLARPRMVKTMIYHAKVRSESFRTTFQTKICNVIGFYPGPSFTCVWSVTKSNPIHKK